MFFSVAAVIILPIFVVIFFVGIASPVASVGQWTMAIAGAQSSVRLPERKFSEKLIASITISIIYLDFAAPFL